MKSLQKLFDGTVFSLVNAIDAKDQYTHGHSSRVAVYSRRIAELSGKSEKECEEIYLSAILHDVGKIGIPGEIINKKGRLTDEEYQAIKQHPTIGYGILKDITEYPFLGVAISSETTILDQEADVLLALTGDQCAITNIRITQPDRPDAVS